MLHALRHESFQLFQHIGLWLWDLLKKGNSCSGVRYPSMVLYNAALTLVPNANVTAKLITFLSGSKKGSDILGSSL